MKVIPFLINSLARQLLKNGPAWENAKALVQTLEDSGLPGDQKKAAVIARLKEIGYALTSFGLNVAVELAWLWLNATVGKKVNK